jgi:ABC-type Fe3+/spermidine/putrescine transport system ATPase subunit
MTFLELTGIQKLFAGGVVAVDDFNLSAARGEFVSFLGPSGCGKTTTLRMIAGFEKPTAGAITVDGEDITYRAPNQRNVGMVFQSYALFPNMNVAENIGFGLKVRKRPKAEIAKRVDELIALTIATRGRCRAASSSGWHSPARWRSNRRSCCWMSPCPPWMRRSGSSCARRSGPSSASWASPRCT